MNEEPMDDQTVTQHLLRLKILTLGPCKGTYIWLAPLVKWVKRLKKLHLRHFKQYTEITTPATCDAKSFVRMEQGLGNEAILDYVHSFDGKVLVPTSESCLYGSMWFQNICKKRAAFPLRYVMYSRVWRRERKVTPLLRNTEIIAFWQCHTVHQSYEESFEESRKNAQKYSAFFQQLGLKTFLLSRFKSDAFIGAQKTWALDFFISGRRLQIATSHDIGDSYARIFDLCTRTKDNKLQYVWQSCHGMTERVLGAILHSSIRQNGCILLPKVLRLKQLITVLPPVDQDYAYYDIIHTLRSTESLTALIDECLGRDSILTVLTKQDGSQATIMDRTHRRKMFPEEAYFYDSAVRDKVRGGSPSRSWPLPTSFYIRQQQWEQTFLRDLAEGEVLYGYDDMYVYGGPSY